MKRLIFSMLALVVIGAAGAFAQKKEGSAIFEEASAREATPNVAVFVFPQICDLNMLSSTRVDYGPYDFTLAKDLNAMNEAELANVKTRALQKACKLAGADLIIEPLYTSTVYDKDNKTIWVSLSGYPASYVNFRSLKPADIEMIRALYPNGVNAIQSQNAGNFITTAREGVR